jgi:FkbM family methyltransferase
VIIHQIANTVRVFNEIRTHPMLKSRVAAYGRWARWQLRSRLAAGPIIVPFVNGTKLSVRAGMHGATKNIYLGLDEYRAMTFVAHFLRPGELFADVGANVGTFTVLASGVVGARTKAFEPSPDAANDLRANIGLNRLESLVEVRAIALGDTAGEIGFTTGLGPMNHVLRDAESSQQVQTSTLDAEFPVAPTLLKLDAEGFEGAILEGGRRTLASPALLALVVEITEHCQRYGVTPSELFDRIVRFGFVPVHYDPLLRRLTPRSTSGSRWSEEQTTIFVRNVDAVTERLIGAPRIMTVAFEV